MLKLCIGAVLFVVSLSSSVEARSSTVRKHYLASLGLTKTPKGCQVDHIIPLHCGGPDAVANLQLICGPSLKAKEVAERKCERFNLWKQECLK